MQDGLSYKMVDQRRKYSTYPAIPSRIGGSQLGGWGGGPWVREARAALAGMGDPQEGPLEEGGGGALAEAEAPHFASP